MLPFKLILKNLEVDGQIIVLGEYATQKNAEEGRRMWRRTLGGSRWQVDRRPGLDTLSHLAMKIATKLDLETLAGPRPE